MASKYLVFPLIVSALILHSSILSLAEQKSEARPVIHFINAVPHKGLPHVGIRIEVHEIEKARIALGPGQTYQLKVDGHGKYYAEAGFGRKFTKFFAYDPARDRDKENIYWRADNGGFDFRHDNKSNWESGHAWESED